MDVVATSEEFTGDMVDENSEEVTAEEGKQKLPEVPQANPNVITKVVTNNDKAKINTEVTDEEATVRKRNRRLVWILMLLLRVKRLR